MSGPVDVLAVLDVEIAAFENTKAMVDFSMSGERKAAYAEQHASLVAARAAVAELTKDAARWRYLRRKLCLTGNGDGTCAMQAINLPAAIPGWPEPGAVVEFCDAAIDAALARVQGVQP